VLRIEFVEGSRKGRFAMARSLEDVIDSADSTVGMLRNMQTGPNVYPVTAEFTNWRDEQWAWQNTCILFDLSYHMVDLRLEGPDALEVLKLVGFNSFAGFEVNKAKQLAPCNPDGKVIGDVILFHLEEDVFELVGRIPTINWVVYHAETGDFDVEWDIDQRTVMRDDPSRRRSYRVQIQGPNAMATMEKLLGQDPPDVKFFNMTTMEIADRPVNALRHGMAGQPGFEIFGPWEDKEPVVEAIVSAGEEFGIRRVGARAYSSNTLESGWIPSPLPAVYTGDARPGRLSEAPSSPTTSRTTTSRPGISATATSSDSTTNTSARTPSRRWPRRHRPGRKSPSPSRTRTCSV
jgi:glycine cleavage system aminomethyltransferase T